MANLPEEKGAFLGRLEYENNRNKWKQVANEGARTIPPREHGGNNDIKNISRGSRVYLPVYVKGAKLSLGDIHFSQGDGEISFCGAIEMVFISSFQKSIVRGLFFLFFKEWFC